jgi:hypothetical protein
MTEHGTLRVILPDYNYVGLDCTRETSADEIYSQLQSTFDNNLSGYCLFHVRDNIRHPLAPNDRVWKNDELWPVFLEKSLVC